MLSEEFESKSFEFTETYWMNYLAFLPIILSGGECLAFQAAELEKMLLHYYN